MEHTGSESARLDRVETEVATIRTEVGGLTRDLGVVRADVRGLGSILTRIEEGIGRSQERADKERDMARPNLIAVVSVLITIISIIVGGAWLISGQLARLDERSLRRDIEMNRAWKEIDDTRRGNQHEAAKPPPG